MVTERLVGLKQRKQEILNRIRITKERKSQAIKNKVSERWIQYYNKYLEEYNKHLSQCNQLIRKERFAGLRGKLIPILIVLIILVFIAFLISLLILLKPQVSNFFKGVRERVREPEIDEILKYETNLPVPEIILPEYIDDFGVYMPPLEVPKISTILKTASEEIEILNPVEQSPAVLGKPVKWKTRIVSDDPAGFEMNLPANSKVLRIEKIENGKKQDITSSSNIEEKGIFRKRVEVDVRDIGTEYQVEYETEAPIIVEEELNGMRKKITISGPDNVHYQDVLSSASIPEILEKGEGENIRVYQIEQDGEKIRRRIKSSAYDTDENGKIDTVEWISPYLSEASFIIIITKAEHLDENQTFLSDIYSEVAELDGIWSEPIYHDEYIRVTFESELTNENDITFYARNIQQENTIVEVYYFEGEKITEFPIISGEGEYKVLLTDLPGGYKSDVFDLRVKNLDENLEAYLEFDYIVDPVISGCPYVINDNSDPLFVLNTDPAPIDGYCIVIQADDVIVDLNGHTISGNGLASNFGVLALARKNVTIRNGNITGFNYSIYFSSTNESRIENLTLTNASSSLRASIGFYNRASNNIIINTIMYNNSNAIYFSDSLNNIIINNTLTNNIVRGITFYSNSNNNTAINNTLYNNERGFYVASSSNNTLIGNTADSVARGIIIISGSNNTQVQDSSLSGGVVAIHIDLNSLNNTFLNTSYNSPREYVAGGSELIRSWYYQASVTYGGNPVAGANISAYNRTGNPDGWMFNLTTNSTGWTNRTQIIEYINNTGVMNYYSDYVINTTNITYSEGHYLNVTWEAEQSDFGGLIFDEIILEIADLENPNIEFVLPTPQNQSQDWNWIPINVTANDTETGDNNISVFIDFNQSLVGWWRMDDLNASGDPIDFFSLNNGSAKGDATQTNGYLGKGFEFDGNGDYIQVADDPNFDFTEGSSFTISAWINPGTSDEEGYIVSKFDLVTGWGLYFDGSVGNDKLEFMYDGAYFLESSSVFTETDWIFVSFAYSDGQEVFYKNGVRVGQYDQAISITSNTHDLIIGNRQGGGLDATTFFDGSIDDVMIFDRTLSDEEIRALYANQTEKNLFNNFTNLVNGNYTFRSYAQDAAGNINFTDIREIKVDSIKVTECGVLDQEGAKYILAQNVSSSGTCFDITSNNVSLDCQGYEINYSYDGTLGYGVYSNQNFSEIKNCVIVEGEDSIGYKNAIYFNYTNNGTIENNVIITNGSYSYGIHLYYSHSNFILNNNISTAGTYADALRNEYSYFNEIHNNNLTAIANHCSGLYFFNSYNLNLTNNNITSETTKSIMISDYTGQLNSFNHSIDTTNTADGKPVLYIFNNNSIVLNEDLSTYGQIIFTFVNNTIVNDSTIGRNGLTIYYAENLSISNNNFTSEKPGDNSLYIEGVKNSIILNNTFVMNDVAIQGSTFTNSSVENNSINAEGTFGMKFSHAHNNTFKGNIINLFSGGATGIYINKGSSNNIFDSEEIFIDNYGQAFYIESYSSEDSLNNLIRNSNITITGVRYYSYALRIEDRKTNTTIIDTYLNSLNSHDIYARLNWENSSLVLVNVTWNETDANITNPNFTISHYNYLDVNVTSSNNPVEDVNVTGFYFNGTYAFNSTTNATGFIERQNLLEFFQNSTDAFYEENYTIEGNHDTYGSASASVNMSESKLLNLELASDLVSACRILKIPNSVYTQVGDIVQNANESCINITAENVTFDGGGYSITSALGVQGVYSNSTNTTIKNCNVNVGSGNSIGGIELREASNSYIFNNTVLTTGVGSWGIFLSSVHGAVLENNIADTASVGLRMIQSSNNTIINNSFDQNGQDRGILLIGGLNNVFIENSASGGGNSAEGIAIMSESSNNTFINNTANSNEKGFYIGAGSTNNTFINNIANSNENYGFFFSGSFAYPAVNNTLINTTANSNKVAGIYLLYSYDNTFINTTILGTSANPSQAIYIGNSKENKFIGGIIDQSNDYAIRFGSSTILAPSSHNMFENINITNTGDAVDIFLEASGDGEILNNTFLNASYYEGEFIGVRSELIRSWHYQANATYDGDPVEGVNLSAYNVTGIPDGWQFNITTNSSGWTNRTPIIDYVNINNVKSYYSNYTIDASNGSVGSTHKLNVTWEAEQEDFGGLIFDEIILELIDISNPDLVINAPENDSIVGTPGWALLNWSIYDLQSSNMEVWIWGSNDSSMVPGERTLLYHRTGLPSGNYTYNWTSLVTQSDESTVLLFHFDNLNEFGESTGPGGIVYDFSGHGNNGTLGDPTGKQVPVWNETGKFAGTFEYNGSTTTSGRCIQILDSDSLDFAQGVNFTISLWTRSTSLLHDSDLLRKGSTFSLGSAGPWWKLEWGDDNAANENKFHFNIHNGASDVSVYSGAGYNDGGWHHVVAMRDGTNQRLFVDGVLVGVNTVGTYNLTNIANLSIGCKDTLDDDYFNGSIDEVVIWNKSLTNQEVYNLYNLSVGRYYWQVNVSDGQNTNSSWVYYFNLTEPPDLTPPSIFVISPKPKIYDITIIEFNVSLNENSSWCGFSLDGGGNITMTRFNDTYFNYTYTLADETNYSVKFYCNDTSGNMNTTSSPVNFTVNTGFVVVPPWINFTFPTPPNDTITTNRTITINVSIEEQTYPLGEIIFNWNGTNYTIFDESLIFLFNFDNISALGENDTFVADATGMHNATCKGEGCPRWHESGKFGGAFDYRPENQTNFTIQDHSDFDLTDFTIMAWIKTAHTGNPNDDYEVFASGGIGHQWTFGLTDNVGYEGLVRIHAQQGSSVQAFGTTNLVDMQWHHIVGVRNASSYTIYVDGNLERVTADANAGDQFNPTSFSKIGGVVNPDQNETFNGTIDNLMLWGRALNSSEITQLYFTNLYKYDVGKWQLYINQSKNSTNVLDYGNYTYQTFVSDIEDHENQTEVRTVSIINAPPRVSLDLPFYSDILNYTNVSFKCSAIDEDGIGNITLYGNWSGGWHANYTRDTSGTSNESIVSLILTDKASYWWNCRACDSSTGECSFASYNYTFTIDTDYTPPFTRIWIPTHANHTDSTGSDLEVTHLVNASDGNVVVLDPNENITVYSWNDSLSYNQVLRYAIAHVEITDSNKKGAVTYIQTNNSGEFETCGPCVSGENFIGTLTCHLTLHCGIDTNEEVNNLKLRTVVLDPGGPPNADTDQDYIWLDVAYKNRPIVVDVKTFDNETFEEKTDFGRRNGTFINVSVTDGEGQEDLDEVLITILNPFGTVMLNNASMINYSSIGTSGYVYNYSNWMVPTDAIGGQWRIIVYAIDNSGIIGQNETNFTVAANQYPSIIWVEEIPNVIPFAGGIRNIKFNFTVFDPDGYSDLDPTNARGNFSKKGYAPVRENLSCSFISGWGDYANYTCEIGMMYFDKSGDWNVTVAISDYAGLWALNDTEIFHYNTLSEFDLVPEYVNWSEVELGSLNQLADNNITVRNLGNSEIFYITINATDLNGTEIDDKIPTANFRSANSSFNFCSAPQLIKDEFLNIQLKINYTGSSLGNPESEEIGFCLQQVPSNIAFQLYDAERDWEIEAYFTAIILSLLKSLAGLKILLVAFKVKKKKKKKKKGVFEIFDKRLKDKYVDFEGLLSLDESLREKYNLGVEELLEIAKKKEEVREIKIPIILFKQKISPAEILCKYLKENLGLRFSEIAKLLNRDDRTVWINYRNAIKKKSEKIEVEKKILISIKIFSDRRLSILEAVVNYLKEKGFRNNEIAEILNKDQRNIYTLYSRAKKKLI